MMETLIKMNAPVQRLGQSMLLGVFMLMGSNMAFADNCENARNAYDDIYCTNKIFASADAELNKNYKLLQGKLNTSQKSILKKSQLAWIRERDEQCSDNEERRVFVNCNLEQTQERNAWLIERIRECNTVGCKTNVLRN